MTTEQTPPEAPIAGPQPPADDNPFIGPRPFEPGERLFGRTREARELHYLLSAERIVWLHSPSGAGKTSLIQTSLTRQLHRDGFAVYPPVRVNQGLPDGVPADTNPYLLSVVLGLEDTQPGNRRRTPAELAALGLPGWLRQRSQDNLAAGHAGTVLLLDQFEEVLTLRPTDREAKVAFFQALGEALRDDNLWCLFALREEYLSPLEPYVDCIPTRWANTFRLDLLDEPAMREVLRRTARQGDRNGARTFTNSAIDQLFADLARTRVQQPDGSFQDVAGRFAEPMQLQVVCRRLWDAMPAADRSIDPEDLERFGDVSQALGGYYDDELARIAAGNQALEHSIRDWLGDHLIAPGGIRSQVMRRKDETAGLDNATIHQLVDAHLIRAEQRAGATWYELAHDRLVAPVQARNAAWKDEHLQPFQRQTVLWVQAGRPANGGGQLLRGGMLRDALDFETKSPCLVSDDDRQLIDMSTSARYSRRRMQVVVALLACLAAGFVGGVAFLLSQMKKEHEARYESALGYWKDAMPAPDFDARAAAHALAAAALRFHQAGKPTECANVLLALQFTDYKSESAVIDTFDLDGRIWGAVLSPSDGRLLTWSRDGTVRLWNAVTGDPITPPLKHRDRVLGAQLSRDETRILTWSEDGTARLWDAATSKPLTPPLKHQGPIWGAQLSDDETRILTWSRDSTARLWDAATGKPLTPPLMHEDSIRGAQLSRDDTRILTWSDDGTAQLWDAATGEPITPPLRHGSSVLGALFSRDESRILTWSDDGTARLWDAANGESIIPPLRHESSVLGALLSRDESRILTWSDDGTARPWDAATGEPITPPLKHEGPVLGAQFSRDESRILTWSRDATARLWNTATGASLIPPLKHEFAVSGARFSRDESYLLTWTIGGTLRLWDAASGEPLGRKCSTNRLPPTLAA